MFILHVSIASCLPIALLLGCGSSSGVSSAPANQCEKLLAHVERMPDYWDGLRGPENERKDANDMEQTMAHFSHHTGFLRGCAKLDEEQSGCITKAGTWLEYQSCDVTDTIREGAQESFRAMLAKRSETTVEAESEDRADCEKLTRRAVVLATRFLPEDTKKKLSAAMEPEMKKQVEKCNKEAPPKKLEVCMMAAKDLASATECQILIGTARRKGSAKGNEKGSAKGNQSEPASAAVVLGELETLADEMCACKDEPCTKIVSEKLTSFTKRHSDTKPDEATMNRVNAAAMRLSTCQMKLVSQQ